VRVFQLNEIIDVKSGHRVVTAIEVLGPTNKRPGEGQRLYLQKREDQQSAAVNTVEIDLLRGGTWDLKVDRDFVETVKIAKRMARRFN
jgi:Protein of unknown function (DUF4058)